MGAWPALLVLLSGLALSRPVDAADVATTPRVEARLISASLGVPASGGTISLALHQKIAPGWHTYWRNPGDSGEATELTWTTPAGFTIGAIQWPTPEAIKQWNEAEGNILGLFHITC